MERFGTIEYIKPNNKPGHTYVSIKTNRGRIHLNCLNKEVPEIFLSETLPRVGTLVKIIEAPQYNVPRIVVAWDDRMAGAFGLVPEELVTARASKQNGRNQLYQGKFKTKHPPTKKKGSWLLVFTKNLGQGIGNVIMRLFMRLLGKVIYLAILATIAAILLPELRGSLIDSGLSMLHAIGLSFGSRLY